MLVRYFSTSQHAPPHYIITTHKQMDWVQHHNRTTQDCIRKYANESQNWLELLDGILFFVCLAKHYSTKYNPFHIMYNRDPMTPFQLADNQRDGNPVPPTFSGESMTTDQYISQSQSILAKVHTNIKYYRFHKRSIITCGP